MKATIIITAMVILVLIASPVQADLVELDLLALGCPTVHDFDTPQWTYDFDLGVQFSNIQHVYMDWSGEITGGLADHIGNPDPYPAPVLLYARLGIYPSYRHTDVSGGWTTYPEPEFFSEISEFNDGTMPWNDLFDGNGMIRIQYSEYIILDGWYVEHGSVSLTKAKLVVEGTVIPEPSSFLIIFLGGVVLHIKRRK
jgi:hypothetical protein